ncbi:hypothetical protein [Sphingomonas sp.]|uniref:hypothetical protein n=1 Tax=Sphingomonas sp. TaxID=28214 RepID=UPI003B3B4AC0
MLKPKQYVVELFAAMALYGLLLVGANMVERATDPHGPVKLLLNLVPMIGVLVAAWVILRHLWRMDELQRRIQFHAISLSFIGTALITFGWGFAEGGGAPHLRAFAVWPIMGALWGLGVAVASRRYR